MQANLFLILQFGNTCYCNSVLQALYFCRPFRDKVLAYKSQPRKKENLLTCLADLFHSIATQKKKVGVIPPKKFITRLRKENGNFFYLFLCNNHSYCDLILKLTQGDTCIFVTHGKCLQCYCITKRCPQNKGVTLELFRERTLVCLSSCSAECIVRGCLGNCFLILPLYELSFYNQNSLHNFCSVFKKTSLFGCRNQSPKLSVWEGR